MVSPAYHAAISHALANFALRCVRMVVEEKFSGRVVYAGGDDVLALLPVEHALPAARDLRALFGGQVRESRVERGHDGPRYEVEFICENEARFPTGYLVIDGRPMMVMGPQATASVGIAIAHHKQPLVSAIESAREAEKAAKDLYNRNAFMVTFLKRSGERLQAGAQWYYDDVPDTVQLVDEVQRYLAEEWLSFRFPHTFFAEVHTLAALGGEALEKELGRLIRRHMGKNAPTKAEGEKWANDLASRLAKLAQALETHRAQWASEWRKYHPDRDPDQVDEDKAPQAGAVELGKWLLLARALARVQGGGE